jgi:hypothetical protein
MAFVSHLSDQAKIELESHNTLL